MLKMSEIREKLQGVNLAKMSKEIGVTSPYLSQLKNGVRLNPSSQMQEKISDYFERIENQADK